MVKIVSITKSDSKGKKFKAVFKKADGRTETTHFGAKGYSDFTQHKNKERRSSYLARHKSNEKWSSPTTAGSLSRHILWGASTSRQANIRAFKRKFSL
jgi:hypothetical protein